MAFSVTHATLTFFYPREIEARVRHSPPRRHASIMSSLASSRALAHTRVASRRSARGPARRAGAVFAVRAERSSRDAVPAQLHDARSRCAAFAAAVLVASAGAPAPALAGAPKEKPPAAYVAELVPTPGHAQVSGSIRFEAALNKSGQEVVFVSPSVNGLAPGPHGINVHDVAGDGSVGASFNPDGRPHGSPSSIKKFGASACHFVGEGCQWNRHAGDLGNLVADADGNAQGVEKKFKDLYVSLNPKKPECVAGKAVVVRARADDFKTEADDGDAGEIVAVGVIKAAAA